METDEVLETGYGDGAPSGDNILNDFARGESEGFAALARARGDRVEELPEFAITLVDGASPTPFGNTAVLRAPLTAEQWVALTGRMHAFYDGNPGGPYMVMSAWPTPDLKPLGFGLVGHPPLMLRPVAPLTRKTIDNFEIRRVSDAASARDWEYVMVHGYPTPELQPFQAGCFLPERALAAPRWQHYVGYLDGRAVATSSAYVADHHQHVEFISALDDARGRGIGYEVTAQVTVADPSVPALLIASDLGKPVYDRLGYLTISRHTLWVGHRP
jgi:hypothetical protein